MFKGSSQTFCVVPETNIVHGGGGGGGGDMYMHAIFVVHHSELHSFQREGSEYKMNDVRFKDNKQLLRRPLSANAVG